MDRSVFALLKSRLGRAHKTLLSGPESVTLAGFCAAFPILLTVLKLFPWALDFPVLCCLLESIKSDFCFLGVLAR